MSHTRRKYNLPGYLFWHPYHQHPNWHRREDLYFTRTRRQARKSEARLISEEFAAFGLFTWDAPYDLADQDTMRDLLAGLEDFISCRCKHFKNDEELEEYLMADLPSELAHMWNDYLYPEDDFYMGDWY